MEKMKNVLVYVAKGASGISSISAFAMMLLGGADLLSSMLFNRPMLGTVEMMQVLMVVVIFMSLTQIEVKEQHITIGLLYDRFPFKVKCIVNVFRKLFAALFFGAMAYQGWGLFMRSWLMREYAMGSVAFPVYPTKGLFFVGASLMTIYCVYGVFSACVSVTNVGQSESPTTIR